VAVTVAYTRRLLARRVQHLTSGIDDLTRRRGEVLADHAPGLLHRRGIGPDRAAGSSPPATPRSASTTRPLLRCAAPVDR
jgi:hypothetical protein